MGTSPSSLSVPRSLPSPLYRCVREDGESIKKQRWETNGKPGRPLFTGNFVGKNSYRSMAVLTHAPPYTPRLRPTTASNSQTQDNGCKQITSLLFTYTLTFSVYAKEDMLMVIPWFCIVCLRLSFFVNFVSKVWIRG